MKQRTKWTDAERDAFVAWHESVIEQYPADVQTSLRRDRRKFLEGVRRADSAGGGQ